MCQRRNPYRSEEMSQTNNLTFHLITLERMGTNTPSPNEMKEIKKSRKQRIENSIQKSVKSKVRCLKKINKIDKSLAKLTERKRRLKFRKLDRRKDYSTNLTAIKRIIKEFNKQYGNKLDNLDEIDKLLEIYILQKITQEKNRVSDYTSDVVELLSKNYPKGKPRPKWLHHRILRIIHRFNMILQKPSPQIESTQHFKLILSDQYYSYFKTKGIIKK